GPVPLPTGYRPERRLEYGTLEVGEVAPASQDRLGLRHHPIEPGEIPGVGGGGLQPVQGQGQGALVSERAGQIERPRQVRVGEVEPPQVDADDGDAAEEVDVRRSIAELFGDGEA